MGVVSNLITWFLECREEPIGVNKVQREFRVKWDNYGGGEGGLLNLRLFILSPICVLKIEGL